nr:L-histidine N(alpha)-methyltransferase [Planosporangium mesophilum]
MTPNFDMDQFPATVPYYRTVAGASLCAVSPDEAFYRTYSAAQVDAIIGSLAQHAEFPFSLTYLGSGSESWRDGGLSPTSAAAPIAPATLLERHAEQLLALVPPSPSIQVVDLGPGTTRPIHGLLRHLLGRSRLAGYRAIDISAEMLELARQNLRTAFPHDADRFELCRGDFTGPDLAQVLIAKDEPHDDDSGPVRFVVMAGGTLYNFAEPDRVLRHVRHAMSGHDLLVLTLRFDTGVDQPPLMDHSGSATKSQHRAGLDLLNIDRSWYVTETGFDRDRSEVFVRARFVLPVAVTFDVDGARRTVSFEPGDTLLVWRLFYPDRSTLVDQLDRNGFKMRLFQFGQGSQVALVAATPGS